MGKTQTALYTVGTDTAKENIFARLNAEDGHETLHFPMDLEEEYFKQLTAEKRITKWIRGRKTLAWKQIRPRNEALDVTVYNFAAIYILNPSFDVIEERLVTGAKNKQDPNDTGSFKPPASNFANSWKE